MIHPLTISQTRPRVAVGGSVNGVDAFGTPQSPAGGEAATGRSPPFDRLAAACWLIR
jgi:hypothetical protein